MDIVLGLSLFTLSLQTGAAVTAFAIARAPGWRRARILGALALTAGAYSLMDLALGLVTRTPTTSGLNTSINLVVAAAHVSAWVWYSFADERGSWRTLPRWVRRLAIGNIALAALVALSGRAVEWGTLNTVSVPWLGVTFGSAPLATPGVFAVAVILSTLFVCLVQQVRHARRGVPGARPIVVGFAFFMLCGLEEAAVAAGWFQFIYLAELGYLGLVVPVTAQLLRWFIDDAHRLADLSTRLTVEVRTATHERDAAREALAAQERFAALGRIAGGVGHEINNPLQSLTLSLEELRDHHLRDASPASTEALAQSFEAADRIGRIVDGLRAYSQAAPPRLEPIDPRDVVLSALRVAGPRLRDLPAVRPRLDPVPRVLADEGKLVQAVVNALVNASLALEGIEGRAPAIEVHTFAGETGDAVIEVRDNGPGFPPQLMPRLGEPFVSTRVANGGSGLGLFVVRGIVDAHGGRLELENARGGGAVLRLRLPAAVQPNARP
ncbi:MAG: ATP-binding protein [Gemmatimonadota bacterium]|nr:ATP-binding protein [Gemmatimonadota bacterium]